MGNKTKKVSFKELLIKCTGIIILVVYLLCTIGLNAQADMGPKPSITLTIVNAPDDYYVALLDNWKEGVPDSDVKFEDVNDDNIEEYLQKFSVDGWYYFQSPVGHNYYKKTDEGVYRFSYMVPNPFRVILVDSDGNVYLSDELKKKEFNADVTYDVAAGTITEDVSDKMVKRVVYIIQCFVFTILIELLIFKLFKYPFSKRNLIAFFIINILTNVPLNLFFLFELSGSTAIMVMLAWIFLEVLITFGESIFYIFTLKEADGRKRHLKNFLYGFSANAASAMLSVVGMFIFLTIFGM